MVKINKKYVYSLFVIIIIITMVIIYFLFSDKNYMVVESANKKLLLSDYDISDNLDDVGSINGLIGGDFLDDGIVSDDEINAMKHNTFYLQNLVNNADSGSVISIPAGVFCFYTSGMNKALSEDYVINLRSDISVVGAGTDEDSLDGYTLLKPYAYEGDIEYGLDMFYYNYYSDSGYTEPVYLENVFFNDFIIDGKDVTGNNYNSSGKGFMINLCKNCHWDNIVVRNTDGTGFGMDNVIDSSIKNSKAINCGKNANSSSYGASGFGIGTGFSNEESMYIENCEAIGNKKFGFFFEHQGIFSSYYNAVSANGFVVVNSRASNNLYNFGGERSNDVVYIDCVSNNGEYTDLDVYFSGQSRRSYVINLDSDSIFYDVNDSSAYYYDAVRWGVSSGITYGIGNNLFGVSMSASRAEALVMLWRTFGMEGDVIENDGLGTNNRQVTNIDTGFVDVDGSSWYAGAVKWAVDNGITNGTSPGVFSPNDALTRAQFITMLWRQAGRPIVVGNDSFDDVVIDSYYYDAVKWAKSVGIVSGWDNNFYPDSYCTREQIITFLYRYSEVIDFDNSITERVKSKYYEVFENSY